MPRGVPHGIGHPATSAPAAGLGRPAGSNPELCRRACSGAASVAWPGARAPTRLTARPDKPASEPAFRSRFRICVSDSEIPIRFRLIHIVSYQYDIWNSAKPRRFQRGSYTQATVRQYETPLPHVSSPHFRRTFRRTFRNRFPIRKLTSERANQHPKPKAHRKRQSEITNAFQRRKSPKGH